MGGSPSTPAATPRHARVVGIVALLWSGFGAYDYVCIRLQGVDYLRQMNLTEAQISYFNAMPSWMTAVWAVEVWGGVLGALLLLARSSWAVLAFAVSLAAVFVSLAYYYVLSDSLKVMGKVSLVAQGVILAVCVLFVVYAWAMAKRRVLR